MKFCKYCGAQLEDNAVCKCEKSRAAQAQAQQANAQAQPQYQQPVQPQQPQYQNPVQQQYAQPQNPQAIFFIALILGNMFLMLSMSALDFPKTLLVSLVTAVLIGGFYSVILFAYVKKYKTEENTAKAFIDSFITFSIESIPASIGWILRINQRIYVPVLLRNRYALPCYFTCKSGKS